ncbi:MAG TPA: DUF3108 domain-containing protein [Kofleriaceae bacterium]|jgi:hypothetical protein|nr:DUF3108 domain-containing protein [Kofleriaceae bacterium]
MARPALALMLAACGSTAPIATPPTTAPTASPAKPAGLVVAPPLVTPGEHMAYTLQLQGVELATLDAAVGEPTTLGGKPAIVVQSHAKAVGLAKMVANIDDTFTSWIDVATGRPLRWSTDEFATKTSDKERTDVDFSKRAGVRLPVTFHLNDAPPQPEPQRASLPETWDFNSFLMALRTWDPPTGTVLVVEVMRSRFMWHVELTMRGKSKLTTALGTVMARQLEGHTYKLDRNGVRAPGSDERTFTIWVSDDDGRVPLEVTAKTDYGDIALGISDYAPGAGHRLRD